MGRIPKDIDDISKSLPKIRKIRLENTYASMYDFLVILYYFRFVEKLSNREISEKLNLQVVDIHLHLYDLGWHYSENYEENKTCFEEELAKFKDLLEEAKKESYLIDINEKVKLKEAINKVKSISKKSYLNLGFKTGEEYARVFYYLKFIKNMSAKELEILFNLTYCTIHYRLRALGFNQSHEEGIGAKKNRGSQNYPKSISAGKKTRIKALKDTFTNGSSKNQEYIRAQIPNTIVNFLDNSEYEVIVGLSNTGILGSLEIDIPIVIYNPKNDMLFRFAIEYNSSYYHNKEGDNFKRILATKKGWYYIPVIELSNGRFSNNRKLLDDEVNKICLTIKRKVEYNNAPINSIKK